jgi:hypothetical protein
MGQDTLFSPHPYRPTLGPIQSPMHWIWVLFSRGKAAYDVVLITESKNRYSYSPTAPLYLVWHVMGRPLPFPVTCKNGRHLIEHLTQNSKIFSV